MKPSVPEKGTVIRIEGNEALVMLEGGKSCKGCGAAKIGLCRAGGSAMFLTVRSCLAVRPGDQVVVGIDARTRRLGYLLAYIIPLIAFVFGALAGDLLGRRLGVPSLDVFAAFVSLFVFGAFSLRKLRAIDRAAMMEVKRVLSDGEFRVYEAAEEEQRYLNYPSSC
jgi:positive regulator of sigma E activity